MLLNCLSQIEVCQYIYITLLQEFASANLAKNTISTNTVTVTMEDEETKTTYMPCVMGRCQGPSEFNAIVRKRKSVN